MLVRHALRTILCQRLDCSPDSVEATSRLQPHVRMFADVRLSLSGKGLGSVRTQRDHRPSLARTVRGRRRRESLGSDAVASWRNARGQARELHHPVLDGCGNRSTEVLVP